MGEDVLVVSALSLSSSYSLLVRWVKTSSCQTGEDVVIAMVLFAHQIGEDAFVALVLLARQVGKDVVVALILLAHQVGEDVFVALVLLVRQDHEITSLFFSSSISLLCLSSSPS